MNDNEVDLNISNEVLTIEDSFSDHLINLDMDIDHLDLKLQSIQRHITTLEAGSIRIETMINNANNPVSTQKVNKSHLYKLLNETLELLAVFEDRYARYSELKFRYRKEQDDLTYKITHLTRVDMKQDRNSELSYIQLIKMFKNLEISIDKDTNPAVQEELQVSLSSIEEDPDYKI